MGSASRRWPVELSSPWLSPKTAKFTPSAKVPSSSSSSSSLSTSLDLSFQLILSIFLLDKDRLIGLPEGRARNHNRPQQVPVLSGLHIQDVAVGAEHTLVLSSSGDVYTWGSNSEGQVLCSSQTQSSCLHVFMSLPAELTELCLTAGSGPHQPRQRTHSGVGAAGQIHQPDLCRTLPQRRLDRPLRAAASAR